MLPRANRERSPPGHRQAEAQSPQRGDPAPYRPQPPGGGGSGRLLGERTITVDCDVLQGDGGTRTASVTGGFIALALACRKLVEEGVLAQDAHPATVVAGVSAGIVDDAAHAGPAATSEDSRAMVDLNCVMNELGELIELQGTGEGRAFTAGGAAGAGGACAPRASGS